MIFLPEVCFGPRNHPSNFVDDPDYDPDHAKIGSGLRSGSRLYIAFLVELLMQLQKLHIYRSHRLFIADFRYACHKAEPTSNDAVPTLYSILVSITLAMLYSLIDL